MPARARRRAPDIRFAAEPPARDDMLPRMDIAVFVGFAASGPVHLPVAVESIAAFEEIFGAAAPLAWDRQLGVTTQAQLAPAVRAFFQGGGKRCWIVRVAGAPAVNYFPLPGLARIAAAGVAPAFARSRSAGRWSDAHRVTAAVLAAPIDALLFAREGTGAVLQFAGRGDAILPGDLVRVECGTQFVAFVMVDEVMAPGIGSRARAEVRGAVAWFRTSLPASAIPPTGAAVVYNASRTPAGEAEIFAGAPVPVLNPVREWSLAGPRGSVELELRMPVADAPEPGALVSAVAGGEQLWMTVHEVGIRSVDAAGVARLRLTGIGMWRLESAPATWPALRRAEILTLDLSLKDGDGRRHHMTGLGLTPRHPRYWADLAADDARFTPAGPQDPPRRSLADAPLFPLAGAGPRDAIYVPIDMSASGRDLGAARQPLTALERDGLAAFAPELFLDAALAAAPATSLAANADHVRYSAENPRRLTGVHAAFAVDEATLVAAPDAAQPGWVRTLAPEPPRPRRSVPFPAPAWGTFLDCTTRVVKPPRWAPPFQRRGSFRFDGGTFRLDWVPGNAPRSDDLGPVTFIVEEAHLPDWSDAAPIYGGPLSHVDVYGRPRGTYYYRVRTTVGGRTSNWSRGVTVVVGGAEQWVARDPSDYEPGVLLAVQRSLLRMASARGDLFAVLGLPAHFRADEAAAHVRTLKAPPAPDSSEARAFSFGALYHPWAWVRDASGRDALARISPEGIAAGLIAKRARARGAWIAPANEPLPGIVGLTPSLARDSHDALLAAAVNVLVEQPRGFLPLSALTLSDEAELEQINVRRLLSLLRRLALREGATYVFEPNDDALRRTVQRGFEVVLTRMFERGAFAGRTAAAAFQVSTGIDVNPPRQADTGRFVVELRVAPSLPMTFLTVRLVQTGDRAAVVEL